MSAEIQDMIDKVVDQDFSKAGPMLHDILKGKMDDYLEAEKIRLSNEIYNGGAAVETDDDITDQEIDDEIESEDFDEDESDADSEEENQ